MNLSASDSETLTNPIAVFNPSITSELHSNAVWPPTDFASIKSVYLRVTRGWNAKASIEHLLDLLQLDNLRLWRATRLGGLVNGLDGSRLNDDGLLGGSGHLKADHLKLLWRQLDLRNEAKGEAVILKFHSLHDKFLKYKLSSLS